MGGLGLGRVGSHGGASEEGMSPGLNGGILRTTKVEFRSEMG